MRTTRCTPAAKIAEEEEERRKLAAEEERISKAEEARRKAELAAREAEDAMKRRAAEEAAEAAEEAALIAAAEAAEKAAMEDIVDEVEPVSPSQARTHTNTRTQEHKAIAQQHTRVCIRGGARFGAVRTRRCCARCCLLGTVAGPGWQSVRACCCQDRTSTQRGVEAQL